MFDAKKALADLDGKTFPKFKPLKEELERVRINHIKDLTPDFGAREIFELMRLNGWVAEDDRGSVSIDLKNQL